VGNAGCDPNNHSKTWSLNRIRDLSGVDVASAAWWNDLEIKDVDFVRDCLDCLRHLRGK